MKSTHFKQKTESELIILEQQKKLKSVLKFTNQVVYQGGKHYSMQEKLRTVIKWLDTVDIPNKYEWI